MTALRAGLDMGYWGTKAVSNSQQVLIPSVVGSPDRPSFSLSGDAGGIELHVPGPALVGEDAIEQSRFMRRREDRGWVLGEEWYCLAMAALSELTAAPQVEATIVTGLPVAFYSDRQAVVERLSGTHRIERVGAGRVPQLVHVTQCRVIPQPFGTVLSMCLDERGRIIDNAVATGDVGVIDSGGKTTNILSVHALREVARETTSINAGAWDVMRAVRGWLASQCPNLDLRDHEVIAAIRARSIKYYGEALSLAQVVDRAVQPLAEQIIAAATQLWNGAAGLDAILITGGGAHTLGAAICRHWRHARIVDDPVMANARGYARFAERIAGKL